MWLTWIHGRPLSRIGISTGRCATRPGRPLWRLWLRSRWPDWIALRSWWSWRPTWRGTWWTTGAITLQELRKKAWEIASMPTKVGLLKKCLSYMTIHLPGSNVGAQNDRSADLLTTWMQSSWRRRSRSGAGGRRHSNNSSILKKSRKAKLTTTLQY